MFRGNLIQNNFEREIMINEKLQTRLERIKELKLELLQLEYETY